MEWPFTFSPATKKEYFTVRLITNSQPREGLNLWSMLLNPYMLMMGFTMVMMFVMPKMMSNLGNFA